MGLMNEEAYRKGVEALLRDEGFDVERWEYYDEDGYIYGYPSKVNLDVVVRDGKVLVLDITAHFRRSDLQPLRRRVELFERATGRKVDRVIVVSPFVDDEVRRILVEMGYEVASGSPRVMKEKRGSKVLNRS